MPISKIKAGGINDDAVTTAKIVDGTVAAVDIADGAVTSAKLSYPLTTFSSTGIDDNATSTAMTLHSTNNLLLGTSTNPFTVSGANGNLLVSGRTNSSSVAPLRVAKQGDNGNIIDIVVGSTLVGSIDSTSGSEDLIINSSDDLFLRANGQDALQLYQSGGSLQNITAYTHFLPNGTNDIGASGAQWRNLYLSGGAYIGGTTAANYLDDYEEGTSEVSVNGITASTNIVNMNYVKVGSLVHIIGEVVIAGKSANSGNANFALPFAPSGTHSFSSTVGGTIHYNTIASSIDYFGLYGGNASVYGNDATGSFTNNYIHSSNWTDGRIGFTLTYTTF